MLKRHTSLVCFLLIACVLPTFAQQSVVEKAKADLAAAGVQVENKACTDFEIAKVVAGRVPGAGLLTKDCCGDANDPNRSHCEFKGVWYAHDIVMLSDGSLVDIAQDGGGANGPTWQVDPPDPALMGRFRSASSLGLTGAVAGAPVPTPDPGPMTPPVTPDLENLKAQIAALTGRVAVLEQNLREADERLSARGDDMNLQLKFAVEDLKQQEQQLQDLKTWLRAHPSPDGCKVSYLGCRPTFNYPPLP
jgi:hypothetical protein